MADLVLKLLGVKFDEAQRVVGRSLTFHGIGLGWVLLLAIVLSAVVFWMYRRAAADVSPVKKYSLATLRALLLVLILGLLLRPVLAFTIEAKTRRSVAVVVDVSKSMSLEDRRAEEADVKRVAIARDILDPAKGLSQALDARSGAGLDKVSRMDVLKSALSNKRLDLLNRLSKEYDLSIYTFDRRLSEVDAGIGKPKADDKAATPTTRPRLTAWIDRLEPKGLYTAVGDSLDRLINDKRGQGLAGIVLITDGASNAGSPAVEAAHHAKQNGFPLYIYGVGIASPRDIIVGNILAQEVAFTKDEVPVTVTVRSQNLANESAKLVLKLVSDKGVEKTVDEKEVKFANDAEQLVPLKFTPDTPGQYELRAEIAPRDDETLKDNNKAVPQPLRVVEDKLKVLLVEQQPRWEFKYLQAMLMRDRRVDLKCLLMEGDRDLYRAPNSPYIEQLPTDPEELNKYHVIILGDVDYKQFSAPQIQLIDDFVSKHGGSLVFLAGRKYNPVAYRGTKLADMLPVTLMDASAGDAQAAADKPIKLRLTALGKSSNMLRLADKDLESQRLWADLPPVYWVQRVLRKKPEAEVLMVDPDDTKRYQGNEYMPVIAVQGVGVGQTLYVGTDNTWRWRKNAGDKYHTMVWSQITYRMALPSILRGSKTTQLKASQEMYTTGDRVTVFARLYTKSFQPQPYDKAKPIRGFWSPMSNPAEKHEALLAPVENQPGRFKAEFTPLSEGVYQFVVEGREKEKQETINVKDPQNEWGDTTAMNEKVLKEMASASGGAFFREEDLYKLPDSITRGAESTRHPFEVEIWSSPLYFLLMMGVVTAEWVLRKTAQLK